MKTELKAEEKSELDAQLEEARESEHGEMAARSDILDGMKKAIAKEGKEKYAKDLNDLVTRAELENRLEALTAEYAKVKAQYDELKTGLLKAKAQGKGLVFETKKDEKADLKRLYPDLDQLGMFD